MIPMLVFYRMHLEPIRYGATILDGSRATIDAKIKAFNEGKIPVLWVSRGLCTGWRTTLTRDQCIIVFHGGGWSAEEILQATMRVSPTI